MAKNRGNQPPRRGQRRRGTLTWSAALHEVRLEDRAAAREFQWLEEAPMADKRKIIAALGFAPGDPKIAESDLADVPQADRVLVPCDRCGTPLWFSAPHRRWAERTSRATGYPCLMACLPCFKAYHDEGPKRRWAESLAALAQPPCPWKKARVLLVLDEPCALVILGFDEGDPRARETHPSDRLHGPCMDCGKTIWFAKKHMHESVAFASYGSGVLVACEDCLRRDPTLRRLRVD